MRLQFVTSTPLSVTAGSGTYTGIHTLMRAVREGGAEVNLLAPAFRLPNYTAQRILFNESLAFRSGLRADVTVGFDMDGYRLPGPRRSPPRVAAIKGVIADERRFERGATRFTMGLQAACEAVSVRRADMVMTTSSYAAGRLMELYRIPKVHSIVPELIDLAGWNELFRRNPARPDPAKFTILCVCRFYPRKRIHLLLEAAASLRTTIPGLQVRIVGGGPEWPRLRQLWRDKKLEGVVHWQGDVTQDRLAEELQRCDLFCLPSVQEGFGIVFLEAMAAGRPIVAANASAVPEVVPQGRLVDPDDAEALAEGIESLYRNPDERERLGVLGLERVKQFDAPRVANLFVSEIRRYCLPEAQTGLQARSSAAGA